MNYPSDPKKLRYAKPQMEALLEILPGIKTAYDCGCGTGIYINALNELKVETLGIELDKEKIINEIKCQPDKVLYINLSEPIGEKHIMPVYDLVISFEVAEHIPANKLQIFIDNLTILGSKYMVITASPDASPQHTNPQPMDYWIAHFEEGQRVKYNPILSEKLTYTFRNIITESTLRWFKERTMVFNYII